MVSISLVLNDGIIKKAQKGVNEYNEAQINELQQLNAVENEMSKYGDKKTDASDWWKLTEEEKAELEKAGHISQDLGQKTYQIVKGKAVAGESFIPQVMCTENGAIVAIIPNGDSNRQLWYTGEDEKMVEELNVGDFFDFKFETLNWYCKLDASGGFAPFKWLETADNGALKEYYYNWLNDLKLNDEDILCPTYYQRLINNFNK